MALAFAIEVRDAYGEQKVVIGYQHRGKQAISEAKQSNRILYRLATHIRVLFEIKCQFSQIKMEFVR